MDYRYKLGIILIGSMIFLFTGIKEVYKNKHNSKTKAFFSGISNIIRGIAGSIIFISFFMFQDKFIFIFILGLALFFGGGFGIIFRKKINDSITFRIDVFSFIGGIMSIVFSILYFLEKLPFQQL